MSHSLEQGFSLGEVVVYPLESRIDGVKGQKTLSPIAMELLIELARANGSPVTAEHLIFQIWGTASPDSGTFERYIVELQHLLNTGNQALVLGDGESYQVAQKPLPLPEEAAKADLWSELQRRKVTQTAALYLVGSWLIIQIADVIFPALGLGDREIRLVVIAAFVGFPISLVLSWFYDVRLAGDTSPDDSSNKSIKYVIAAALLAIPLSYAFQWYYPDVESPELMNTTSGVEVAPDPADFEPNSIAVLAFINLGGDDTYDYFGDGIAEEILNSLSSTRKMLVAPRTSSFVYKDSKTSVKDIATQLGVRYVLEGTVRRSDGKVRVSAQLINVVSGYAIWSDRYDRLLEDIFLVQQEISRQVVRSLNIVLSSEMSEALGAARTANVEAYDFYLQARDYLNQPKSARTLDSAIELFGKAIELDSEYADAFAGLCDSYLAQYVETNTSEWFSKAETACRETLRFDFVTVGVRIALGNLYRESGQYPLAVEQLQIALTKAPDNVDAISALARTYVLDKQLDEAERLFREAIELQPRFWRGHFELGNFYFRTGRAVDAIPPIRRTIELTPDNAMAYNNLGAALFMSSDFERAAEAWQESLEIEVTESASSNAGSSLFFAERFDEAAEMYRKAIELTPDRHALWGNLADAERLGSSPDSARDHYRRAITLAEDALAINPNSTSTKAFLAHYCAHVGQRDRALTLISDATSVDSSDLYLWYYASLTYLTLDNKEAAAQSLKKAIELGYPITMVRADKGLEALTSDAEFRRMIGI